MCYLRVNQLPAMLSTLKKSFGMLQRVITKISVLTVLMTSVFGAFMNLAWNDIRQSTSSYEHFREVSSTFLTFSSSVFKEKHWFPQVV